MKKIILAAVILGLTGFTGTLKAQDDKVKEKDKNKESQEIIIRSKGDKEKKITVVIDGDKVMINGKPMSEFKDDDITITRRNVIVRNGRGLTRITPTPGESFSTEWDGFNDKMESRAFLGVSTEDGEGGAKINNITKESAAEKAGLKTGDLITKVNDKKVDGPESLMDAITSMKPKDEVTVYYKRDGKENQSKAILGERKEPATMAYSFNGPDGMSRTFSLPRINVNPDVSLWDEKDGAGMAVSPRAYSFSNDFNNNYNYKLAEGLYSRQQRLGLRIQDTEEGNGIKVLEVEKDSPADKAGLKKDDIVTEIGGKKISTTDQAREQLQEVREKNSYTIRAKRNGTEMNFEIKIPKKLKTANL